jgi:hypothetical protein
MGGGASTNHEQLEHQYPNLDTQEGSTKRHHVHGVENSFCLGDIVTVRIGDKIVSEGLVVDIIGTNRIRVDCGEITKIFDVSQCELLMSASELEIGDKVEMNPPGSFLFFVGIIKTINPDGTYNLLMEGGGGEDDEGGAIEDDYEMNVPREAIRKIASKRLKGILRKSTWAIVAVQNFSSKRRPTENELV